MKIKQFFLDYPTFKKAQTRYWIILALSCIFAPWVSFSVVFTLIVLLVALGVGQNEDFFFERAVNTEFSNFLYYGIAVFPSLLMLIKEPIASLTTWITILCITLPHLFFRQQFQFIAEQHNQLMILQGKPIPTTQHDTEETLPPFREETLPNKIVRALVATVLIAIGLSIMFYFIKQWFTGTIFTQDESIAGLAAGTTIVYCGWEQLK